MQELEKILEEIDQEVKEYMEIDFGDEYNAGIKDMAKMAKKIIRKHMNDGWIPVDERVPKERVRPICLDFDDYLVTINFGFGARVKTLKYGDGHWWNGPSIVDEYVIAWRTNPEPYHPERSNDEKE